mmetsp:Transcript_16825/g.42970  ORF Transcript_16825/g.42970 Transcript_16825/m.42970 type:complete len:257 (-) Transcript_16825:156-926(-)
MLNKVLIVSASGGVVLFEKEWVQLDKAINSQMLGGLLSTIQEFSRQSTGMLVHNIKFASLSIACVHDVRTHLLCCIISDSSHDDTFPRVLAKQLLVAFVEEHKNVDFTRLGALNVATFASFGNKTVEIIVNSVKTILTELHSTRGIQSAAFVFADDTTFSVGTSSSAHDELGLVANMRATLSLSSEILQSSAQSEPLELVTLHMCGHVARLHCINDAILIVLCQRAVEPAVYSARLDTTVRLLIQVMDVLRNLRGT